VSRARPGTGLPPRPCSWFKVAEARLACAEAGLCVCPEQAVRDDDSLHMLLFGSCGEDFDDPNIPTSSAGAMGSSSSSSTRVQARSGSGSARSAPRMAA